MAILTLNGLEIAYDLFGDPGASRGPSPVVMIHGLGTNRHVWSGPAGVLARHRAVLTLDLPGAGRSSDDPDGYSIPRWVSQLRQLSQQLLGSRPVVVAGHSMGTVTAVHWAASHPDSVAALVLVGMLTGPAPGLVERARKVQAEGLASVLETVLGGQLTAAALAGQPGLTGLFRAVLESNRPAAYCGHCRTLESFSTAAELSRVKCPALLIVGDQDAVTPLSAQLGYRSAFAGPAELAVVASAAHTPQLEQPAALAARMLEFLARVD